MTHFDENRLSKRERELMQKSRIKGKNGLEDPNQCSPLNEDTPSSLGRGSDRGSRCTNSSSESVDCNLFWCVSLCAMGLTKTDLKYMWAIYLKAKVAAYRLSNHEAPAAKDNGIFDYVSETELLAKATKVFATFIVDGKIEITLVEGTSHNPTKPIGIPPRKLTKITVFTKDHKFLEDRRLEAITLMAKIIPKAAVEKLFKSYILGYQVYDWGKTILKVTECAANCVAMKVRVVANQVIAAAKSVITEVEVILRGIFKAIEDQVVAGFAAMKHKINQSNWSWNPKISANLKQEIIYKIGPTFSISGLAPPTMEGFRILSAKLPQIDGTTPQDIGSLAQLFAEAFFLLQPKIKKDSKSMTEVTDIIRKGIKSMNLVELAEFMAGRKSVGSPSVSIELISISPAPK